MSMTVSGDGIVAAEFTVAADQVPVAVVSELRQTARAMGETMSETVRRRPGSGATAESIEVTDVEDGAEVGPTHFVARFLEFGVGAHEVAVESARVLAEPGGQTFGRVANHPGVPAYPFVFPSAEMHTEPMFDRVARIAGDV